MLCFATFFVNRAHFVGDIEVLAHFVGDIEVYRVHIFGGLEYSKNRYYTKNETWHYLLLNLYDILDLHGLHYIFFS